MAVSNAQPASMGTHSFTSTISTRTATQSGRTFSLKALLPKKNARPPKATNDFGTSDEVTYPSTSKQIMTMASVGLVIFLVSLDRTILATATPKITDEFDSISDLGWYASAYMLTMSSFMLLFGRIYTFYSPKVVFLTCILIFEIGSAISGAASSSTAFIIGRAVSGIGASAIMGGGMVIMFVTVPLHRRPILQAAISCVWLLSSVAGPLLGGVFTSEITWRWCFYINLPIGIAVLVYLLFFLQAPAARETTLQFKEKLLKLDPLGTVVLLPCIICLLLALQWGGVQYAWSDWRIILLLVLFAVLLASFVGIQIWKQESATLPPRIIKQRTIALAAIGQMFVGASLTVMTYFVPIWFQAVQQVDAVQSGMRTLSMIISMGVASLISGILVSRTGYYAPFMILGFALMTVGAGVLSLLTPEASLGQWLGFQIPFGFGLGMGMQQANLAAQTVLPRKDIGTGAGLMIFAQTLGGSIFVSVAQNIFANELTSGLSHIPGIDPALITSSGATDLYKAIPSDLHDEVRFHYNSAIVRGAFYVAIATSIVAFVAALGIEWRSVKSKKQETSEASDSLGERDQHIKV